MMRIVTVKTKNHHHHHNKSKPTKFDIPLNRKLTQFWYAIKKRNLTNKQTNKQHITFRLVGWLVFWHINMCRLFNAKSIFFTNDQFYFKQFSLAWVHSLIVKNSFYFKLFSLFKQLSIIIQLSASTVSMSKTVQFQTIQSSKSMQFKYNYSLIVKKHFYFWLFSLVK